MVIKKGDKVSLDYEGKFEDGTVFDSSTHGDHSHPLEFEVGAGHVIPGFNDSVIGMKKETPVDRFVSKMPGPRLDAAGGDATVCGSFIVSDDRTGLALSIEPVRLGGLLSQALPSS